MMLFSKILVINNDNIFVKYSDMKKGVSLSYSDSLKMLEIVVNESTRREF